MTSNLVAQLALIKNFGSKDNANIISNKFNTNILHNSNMLKYLTITLIIVIILLVLGIFGFYYKFRAYFGTSKHFRNSTDTYEFYADQSTGVKATSESKATSETVNNENQTGARKKSNWGQSRSKRNRKVDKEFKKAIQSTDNVEVSNIIPLNTMPENMDPENMEKMPYKYNIFGWYPSIPLPPFHKFKFKRETPKKRDSNDPPPNKKDECQQSAS